MSGSTSAGKKDGSDHRSVTPTTDFHYQPMRWTYGQRVTTPVFMYLGFTKERITVSQSNPMILLPIGELPIWDGPETNE